MKRREVIKGLSLLPLAGTSAFSLSATETAEEVRNSSGPFAEKNPFRALGVEPLINCVGTFTIIGGSIERPYVRAAMEAASTSFVQYDELADGIGQRIAELTKSEWGMVSAGCAAGLKHVTAACVAGGNPEKLIRIPDLAGFEKTEVVIPANSRNAYDHAVRNIGVKLITVNTMEELAEALGPSTAMIYLMSWDPQEFQLEAIAKIARPKKIPILMDAAAEDLTVPNVHLQKGADVVAYSGGKALCGPQCAGLLLGRKDLLMSAWQASSPHHGPCRDNKVGREEMMGMLAAVEAWVTMDHDAKWKKWLSYLDNISKVVTKTEGVITEVIEPVDLSNHSPVLNVTWDSEKLNITGEEVAEELGKNKPRIAVAHFGARGYEKGATSISITTGQMQPGEDKIVAERLNSVLKQKRNPRSTELMPPAINIAGRWEVTVVFFSSTSLHYLNIEQDGGWLQGTHKGDFSIRDMTGTIEGTQIKIRSIDRSPGDSVTFIFSGTATDGSLIGDIYMGEYRTAKFSAKRYGYKNKRQPVVVPGGPPLAT